MTRRRAAGSRLSTLDSRLADSFARCRSLTRRTAGNFGYAFWALPAAKHRAMDALYAFMRKTDDIGDDAGLEVSHRALRLADWRRDLQATLTGRQPDHWIWPALAEVVRTYRIPEKLLTDVIDGVEMDLSPRPFPTFGELQNYCYHVAGAVGLCCIHIWGYRGQDAEAAAIDCGVAFQLTNILRDLKEDASLGRIYLPIEDLRRFGYTEDDLRRNEYSREFRSLMAFETERAWSYYRKAERLMNDLEPDGRPVFRAMLELYGGLLRAIENRQFDVFSGRIRLPFWRKLWIAGKSLVRKG